MTRLLLVPDKKKALFFAKKELSMLVCNAVNLEGILFTLPEVQTLLEGITVGGHTLNDQMITLNQAEAWKHLFQKIETDQFTLSKTILFELHAIAAKKEALEWGCFRSGNVTVAGTSYKPPPAKDLEVAWESLLTRLEKIVDPYDRAITLFLDMARIQFFYDVNKRMGRFMMNGVLLNEGYPVINLPAKRQLEFNQLMLDFYASNQHAPMIVFMKSCLDPAIIEIFSQ